MTAADAASWITVFSKGLIPGSCLFIRTTGENTGLLDSNTKAVLADSNSDIMRLKKAVEDFRPFQNNIPAGH